MDVVMRLRGFSAMVFLSSRGHGNGTVGIYLIAHIVGLNGKFLIDGSARFGDVAYCLN